MRKNLFVVLAGSLLLSFGSCATISPDQVDSTRDGYNAIGPDYLRYVNEDPRLSIEQKAARKALVDRWEERIRELERDVR